jgi:hypothetical protein
MIKLVSLGLIGLAAFRVMAFCFAYRDELPPAREKSVLALVNDADNDSSMIETGVGIPRFRGRVGKQLEKARASLLQTTSPAETGSGAICSDGFLSDRRQAEGFHG